MTTTRLENFHFGWRNSKSYLEWPFISRGPATSGRSSHVDLRRKEAEINLDAERELIDKVALSAFSGAFKGTLSVGSEAPEGKNGCQDVLSYDFLWNGTPGTTRPPPPSSAEKINLLPKCSMLIIFKTPIEYERQMPGHAFSGQKYQHPNLLRDIHIHFFVTKPLCPASWIQ
ncbi:hypothetical protein CEXT_372671 [Caerostris extrusa]|uniref:Uncharacterized protein n=1 Tax=Caerostris extrusa TaxID=172846 RepID=A0AAV4TR97_CAEEX|nr:hypothetical protein CEXT_372671 [Caerostris extrusa]